MRQRIRGAVVVDRVVGRLDRVRGDVRGERLAHRAVPIAGVPRGPRAPAPGAKFECGITARILPKRRWPPRMRRRDTTGRQSARRATIAPTQPAIASPTAPPIRKLCAGNAAAMAPDAKPAIRKYLRRPLPGARAGAPAPGFVRCAARMASAIASASSL